jgi:CheY-like chemotaxis protein
MAANILVVNDERLNRELISKVLRQAGHKVVEARDAAVALEIFRMSSILALRPALHTAAHPAERKFCFRQLCLTLHFTLKTLHSHAYQLHLGGETVRVSRGGFRRFSTRPSV